MKTTKHLSFLVAVVVGFSLLMISCESNPEVQSQEDILPASLTVEIPEAISTSQTSGGRTDGRSYGEDSIKGNDIYQHLGTFIAVGKGAAKLVDEFIEGLRKHHINRIMTLSFLSEDDNRVKNLVVLSDVEFEGETWDYQLTVTDADSEGEIDGGKALQIFWNKRTGRKGIAIIKPYNCDRPRHENSRDAMFRVNYSEETTEYDAQMEVLISGLPLGNPATDQFAVNTLRMFAGRDGEVVDVYGNSNHPNAVLFSGPAGFNWAFVASSDRSAKIGVAEVGLPPNTLDSDDREVLLKEYSILTVFTNGISAAWPGIDQDALAAYLSNIAAPGYFADHGFVAGGTSPGDEWNVLAERMETLSPYNPKETSNLIVNFK
jgi:hypothetical protein